MLRGPFGVAVRFRCRCSMQGVGVGGGWRMGGSWCMICSCDLVQCGLVVVCVWFYGEERVDLSIALGFFKS
jgi:hypothetical protein